jgi:FAD/FMN-containing dehydrogenase
VLEAYSPNATLLTPNTGKWDYMRYGALMAGKFILTPVDLQPASILIEKDPSDIQLALTCSKAMSIPIIPHCDGHSFAGLSSTNGLLVDLKTFMNRIVAFDPSNGLMTLEAGATLGQVFSEVQRYI